MAAVAVVAADDAEASHVSLSMHRCWRRFNREAAAADGGGVTPRTTGEGVVVAAAAVGVESRSKRSSETWSSSSSPCRDGVVREVGGGDAAVTDFPPGDGFAVVDVVAVGIGVKAFIVFFRTEEALSRRRRGP